MAYNTKELLKDQFGKPVPVVYNEATDSYEVLQGSNGSIHVKVIDGATINATLGDQQAKTIDVTLQNAAVATGEGTPFAVGAYKTLTIEVTGTSTSRTINFEGSSASGTYFAIQGVKLQDYSMATSTTGNNEFWSFDITGLSNFRANLTAVSGGSVSIKGKGVA